MKKSFILILLVSLVFMSACSLDKVDDDLDKIEDSLDNEGSDQIGTDKSSNQIGTDEIADLDNNIGNTNYNLNFDSGDTQTIKVHHNTDYSTYVNFDNVDFKNIHVKIEFLDSEPHNFRLNTITYPNGSTNGPFGLNQNIELNGSGRYIFEFGESLMQGDHWTGDVNIIFSIE